MATSFAVGRGGAPAAAAPGAAVIAKGDLAVSVGAAVDEYTPSGSFVQTLMDSSNGLGYATGSAFDGNGNLFVTDFSNNQILRRDAITGAVTIFSSNSTLGDGHQFDAPESIVFNKGYTDMYVSDANRYGPGGGINIVNATTGAGAGFYSLPSSSGSEGVGESDWLALDANSNLYMTNENPSQGVMKVDAGTGDIVQPSFVSSFPNDGYALSFDKNGDLWVGDTNSILEYSSSGSLLQTISNPSFSLVFAAVFNAMGDQFYAGDLSTGSVYTYDLSGNLQSSFNAAGGVSGLSVAGAAIPPNTGTNRYVVLGDSVPYGHGLSNPYVHPATGFPSTATNQGPSTGAYPSLIAQKFGLTMAVRPQECTLSGDDLAISGAPSSPLDPVGHASGDSNCGGSAKSVSSSELPVAGLAANPAKLVTIQAGADDIDFGNCLLNELTRRIVGNFLAPACVTGGRLTSVNGVPQLNNGVLAPSVVQDLANLRSSLTTQIEAVAPSAQNVAVLDYYQMIPKPSDFYSGSESTTINNQPQLNLICSGLANNMNGGYADARFIQAMLNQTIHDAIAAAMLSTNPPIKVTTVDIDNVFQTHEMCTRNPAIFSGEWMPQSQFQSDVGTILKSHICLFGRCLASAPAGAAAIADIRNYVWRAGHPNSFGQTDIANVAIADLAPKL